MTNIIDLYFDSVGSTATAPSKLWQWSKGQVVRINGIDLPTVYQVHFSNNPTLGTAEPVAVSGNMVSIPDIYLTTGEPVYLFIWLSDETSAGTIRKGTIYVAKRSQPSGEYDPTAEQQTIIDGLIGSINTAVDTAEGYADSAQTYSGNAATSATEALNAKDAAQGYAEQASQTAQGVEILVNRAEDAADDAETAKQDVEQLKQAVEGFADDAESAKTDAETARGEAQGFTQTATTKASEASQSASQASQSATTATEQAQTATAKATEASQSAETATAKASEASASATTATAKASEASASASTATTAKNDAVTAKNAAVTAKTDAETARTGAETAAQSVSASAAQIATNTSDIADLKADLEQITGNEPILFGVGWYATAADGGTATYTKASTAMCAKVAVTEGETVNIKGGAVSSTQRLYVFENSEGKTFGRSLGNLNGEYKVTVPSGAVYMYINNILSVMPSGYYAYKGDPIKNVIPRVDTAETDIAGLQTDIAIISDGGKYEGNLMSGGLTSGYYSASGSITASNTLSHILVNVESQTAVEVGGFLNTTTIDAWNVPAVFFDSDGNVVSVVPKQTSAPYKIDVPDGAVTMGINTGFKASEYPSSLPDGLYCAPFVGDPEKTFVKLSDLSDGDKKLKILTGIIRNDGTGWALLDNTDHEPINMASVELTNIGQIIVNYGFTAKKVLTLIAAPDETFAKQYRIGGSVDLGRATFNVYELPHEVGGQVHYNNTTGEWDVTYSTFDSVSFDSSTGAVTLTHPSVTGLLTKEKYNIHAQGRLCNVWAGRVTDTTITVYFLDASGNIIKNPTADLYAYVTRQVNTRLIDASTIVNASGNFWLYGVMEI